MTTKQASLFQTDAATKILGPNGLSIEIGGSGDDVLIGGDGPKADPSMLRRKRPPGAVSRDIAGTIGVRPCAVQQPRRCRIFATPAAFRRAAARCATLGTSAGKPGDMPGVRRQKPVSLALFAGLSCG